MVLAALGTLLVISTAALAQDVEIPAAPSTTPAAGAAPAPAAAAPAPAAVVATPAPAATAPVAPAATTAPVTTLKVGATGQLVKDLQRVLRRKGVKVAVDGAFGPATRTAVKKLQKRLRLRQTGIVNAALLKKLGLKVRTAAAAAATTPVPRAIAPGASRYLKVFPVAGDVSYSDDYGAARHQGRHEGVDIMADRGTPLVAVDDVVVKRLSRVETGLGGIWVWLQRADGTEYYYAHMSSILPGVEAGTKLAAGQVFGAVGNTGDARYGATHCHFELHPGGGGSVDPYSDLVAVDPTAH